MKPPSTPPSRLLFVGVWIAALGFSGGLCAMIYIAIEKIRAGQGLDTYRTNWLVEFNWIGFLVFVVAAVLALAVGLFFRCQEFREIKNLQERYSGEQSSQIDATPLKK
jgi:hypothetical protein